MAKLHETTFRRLTGLTPFPQPPVLPLRHPVVLMHGFGVIASFRRGGHLHDEAMNLREHGVMAYAPNVAPYNTVPIRAALWEERFEHILEETRTEQINIIAHSMGGLDARYLISEMGWHKHVASLVTISTPHHGTTAASFVLDQPERLRRWIVEIFDWMGTNAMEDETASDFLQAVAELTPEYVQETFNPGVPDHPSVKYWSYGGRAGKDTDVPLNPFFHLLNRVIYEQEGVNDGFVSVDSARWGTFLGTVDADHAQQVGFVAGLGDTSRAHSFYRSIAQMLVDEGF